MRAMPPTVRAWTVALLALAMLAITGVARAQQPIRIWHSYRDAEQEALERVVAGYKGAPVEVLALPHDAYASKLVKAIPVGEGPDIYIDAHERLGDFRSRRIVAPVGDALEEAAYDPQALAAVTVEGQRLPPAVRPHHHGLRAGGPVVDRQTRLTRLHDSQSNR